MVCQDDIYYELDERVINEFHLPFDPLEEDGRSADIIDMLIEYFTSSQICHIGMILENPTNIDPSLNEGLYLFDDSSLLMKYLQFC